MTVAGLGRPLEDRTVISGVGQSDVGRRLFRSGYELTVDACLAAIADAGLTPAHIDGLATYPGAMGTPPGFSPAGVTEVHEALRLKLNWYNGALENPGQLGSVITACAAVAAGYARHVLCFRTVTEGSAQGNKGRSGVTMGGGADSSYRAEGFASWLLPFGAPSAANWIAMYVRRHFHAYGTTREQLAQIPLTCRANAGLNPKAIYRDPLSLDDYLSARMISSPLCLFDCDVPCDGATAVIVSAADAGPDLRRPPVRVLAVGTALHGRNSWDQFEDLTTMACRDAAAMMWRRTDLGPADVEVAELYDGFSFITLAWIEALGFCGKGEGGPFIEGGRRIALDGSLPINTNGGQLSAGRLHGYALLHEACCQLWGEAGDRQVGVAAGAGAASGAASGGAPGAAFGAASGAGRRRPEVAVAAAGGGNLAGCLLLGRP